MHLIEKVRFSEKKIQLPSSKSETHRALILAALNKGSSVISKPLWSEDTIVTKDALVKMGAKFKENGDSLTAGGKFGQVTDHQIDLINSGSSARFLLPVGCLADDSMTFSGSERLHQRPMHELIQVLKNMGGNLKDTDGHLPVT
ncbi:MAG: hypothetical protein D6732_24325, partial [Methanobacteriota archaeon]